MIRTDKYIDFSERLQIANSRDNINIHKEIIQRLKMWRDMDDKLSKLFLSGGVVSVESLHKMFKTIKEKYFPTRKIKVELECDEEDIESFKKYLKKYSDSLSLHDIKFKFKEED